MDSASIVHNKNPRWKWLVRVVLNRLGIWPLLNRLRQQGAFSKNIPHEQDFQFFERFHGTKTLFIDIGANSGQSVMSFRIFNRTSKIISFEPNPLHGPDLNWLKSKIGPSFEFHIVGLGQKKEVRNFYIPFVHGVPLTQEGSFSKEVLLQDSETHERVFHTTGQREFTIQEIQVPMERLDDYGLHPDFVKLDVQKSELDVLKGMERILKEDEPILMIENGIDQPLLIEYLKSFAYHPYEYLIHERRLQPAGAGASSLNLFFLTDQRLAEVHSKL